MPRRRQKSSIDCNRMTATTPKSQETCSPDAPTATDHRIQPKGAGRFGRRYPEEIGFRTSEPVKIPKPPFRQPARAAATNSVLHAKIFRPDPAFRTPPTAKELFSGTLRTKPDRRIHRGGEAPNPSSLPISGSFNSLFKVLCNFPSRYLCAIGLRRIFSFNRYSPATLHCTLKQCDSGS